MSHPDTMMT